MKTILVTGAGGFIGRTTIEPLLRQGYIVHAVTSRSEGHPDGGLIVHRTDLLDERATSKLIEDVRPSHLLHFAWYVEHGKFWESDQNSRWLEASKLLFDRFVASGGERIVASGTCAEYDWQTGAERFTEDSSRIRPATAYGKAKNDLHEYLLAISDNSQTSYAWGRIFFPFGPFESDLRLIPYLITSLLRGEVAECTVGDQIRDFIYVDDVGEAFVQLVNSNESGPVNIGTGDQVSIGEIAKTIGDLMHKPDLIKLGALASRADEPPRVLADRSIGEKRFGLKPKICLIEGLRREINWFAERK